MTFQTPQKLGRYEILEEIGKGAMGIVFLARDPLISRLVALKTFHLGSEVGEAERYQYRARFLREAQSCGILNHPNIVTIHDVVELDESGSAFLAMEYVRGTNLKRVLQQAGKPDAHFVVGVISQIAAALDYAHSKGVIHRDIKPANILLTDENHVKITDFGIARFNTSNLTHDGQLLGTPNYMSPEQIRGGDLDSRADLFALGVVVYEMLTRQKPFHGESLTTVTHRIVYGSFDPPEEYMDDVSPELLGLLEKAMAKDPADRYQKAQDLAEDLRTHLPVQSSKRRKERFNDTRDLSSDTVFQREGLSEPAVEGSAPSADAEGDEVSEAKGAAPPSAGEGSGWRSRVDGVLDQTRTLISKAVPPESRPPKRRVAIYGVAGAVLLVLGLLGVQSLRVSARPGVEDRVADERMAWANRFSRLMLEGARQEERGELGAAVDLFRRAEVLAGDRRDSTEEERQRLLAAGEEEKAMAQATEVEILTDRLLTSSQSLLDAEWRREEQYAAGLRQVAISYNVASAREALDGDQFEKAMLAAQAALELDPAQAEAWAILEEVEPQLARLQGQEAAPKPPPRRSAPRREAASAKDRGSASAGTEEVAQEATLQLEFISDLPRGVLLIYLNEKRLLRESFRFGDRGGFFRRSKTTQGRLQRTFTISPGTQTLRLYVSGAKNRATESRELQANFPAGKSRTLEIRVAEDGAVEVRLH